MAADSEYRFPPVSAEGLHSYAEVLEALRTSVDAVAKRVRVPNNSRVARWRPALERLAAAERRSVLEQMVPSLQQHSWHHPYRDAFLALVDSRLFCAIIEHLLPDLSDDELRDLVAGNFDPALDRPGKRTRDKEFEFFVAAVCRRAGVHTVLGEPDVVMRFREAEWSIAAKRLSSRRQVRENVEKAAKQIGREGRPGFIFLDVTKLLHSDYLIVTHWRRAHETVGGHVLALVREQGALFDRPWGERVRGFMLRAAFPYVSPGFRYGTYEQWMAVPTVDGDGADLRAFLPLFLEGVNGL
jgi:hypothetical protein